MDQVMALPKIAIILITSTTPIGGLSGRRTKDGVKKTPIHRSDQPACFQVRRGNDVGTS